MGYDEDRSELFKEAAHTRDRLSDLRSIAGREVDRDDLEAHSGDHEFLEDFQGAAEKVRTSVALIEESTGRLRELFQNKLSGDSESAASAGEELQEVLKETNSAAVDAREKIRSMERENKDIDGDSAEGRIRSTVTSQLSRRFTQAMGHYTRVQREFQERSTERTKRNIRIVYPSISDAQIEQYMESGDADKVFANAIVDAGHADATSRLMRIQEQHQDIVRLARSIQELHELFVDMATLVAEQGEMLNQIAHNVAQSKDYMRQAKDYLIEANDLQKSARKKKCIILIIVLVIAGVIVLGGSIGAGVGISR